MASLVRVSCINKTDRSDAHERISSIGGMNPNGTRWKLSEEEAIQGIKDDQWSFYVERPAGQRVAVEIATRLGHEYLKTEADGEQPDNLLALPDRCCRGQARLACKRAESRRARAVCNGAQWSLGIITGYRLSVRLKPSADFISVTALSLKPSRTVRNSAADGRSSQIP